MSLAGRIRRQVGMIADELQLSQVVTDPSDYLAARMGGAARTLKFRNGFELSVPRRSAQLCRAVVGLAYHGARFTRGAPCPPDLWKLDVGAGSLTTPTGLEFGLESVNPLIFAETFIYDIHYVGANLSGRTVVDVGANVGDTTLYFAQQGARVIAYEPDPTNFRQLEANLARNPGLRDRVRPIAKAVGADGTIQFHAGLGGASGIHEQGGTVIDVPSLGLRTVLADLGGAKPFLLKADCKGAEFGLCAQPEIRGFERVAVEYLANLGLGSLDDLLLSLRRSGFTRFRTFKHNALPTPLSTTGIVEAE